MTPQEQELIKGLFDRLSQLESQPRDPEAERLIAQGLARGPHAIYALVQAVLVQDEALKLANARIEELQVQTSAAAEPEQRPTSFLDSMREALGGRAPRGSVPSVRTAGGQRSRSRVLPASAPADRFSAPQPQPPLVSSAAHCCLTASAHSVEPVRVQPTENKIANRIWRTTTENRRQQDWRRRRTRRRTRFGRRRRSTRQRARPDGRRGFCQRRRPRRLSTVSQSARRLAMNELFIWSASISRAASVAKTSPTNHIAKMTRRRSASPKRP